MNRMLAYLFKAKRGILGAVLFSAAAMLISALIMSLPAIIDTVRILTHQQWIMDSDIVRDDPSIKNVFQFLKIYGMKTSNSYLPEIISLIAGVLASVFLCGNAFRFGMANGVSRRTITKTTILSVFITSTAMTIISQAIRLILVHGTIYFFPDSLYEAIFGSNSPIGADCEGSRTVPYSTFVIRDMLLYFVMCLIMISFAAAIYGLFRRYGIYGAICGTLTTAMIYPAVTLISDSQGGLSKGITSLFMYDDRIEYEVNGYLTYMIELKAPGITILVSLLTAAALTVYALCMRKTGVRPKGS